MSRATLQRRFPDEPWRWRAAWSSGTIRDDANAGAIGLWVVAIFWNAVTMPALVFGFLDRRSHASGSLVVESLFALVGLALLGVAGFVTLRRVRFGRSTLTLAPFPARPGEPLTTTVRVRRRASDVDATRLTLQCVRRIFHNPARRGSTSYDVFWEAERPATVTDEEGHALLCATFDVPLDARPTDDATPGDRIFWRLRARGERVGIDYVATFELPLFACRPVEETPPGDAMR